jgi:hypothetical protein
MDGHTDSEQNVRSSSVLGNNRFPTYQHGSLQRHEELVSRILAHPELVGINKNDIVAVETEYPLTKKKHAIARPDIVISYRCEKGVCRKFIEVKSGSCRRAMGDLHMQLRKITKYLKYRHIDGEVVGVYPGETSLELLVL